MDAITRSFVTAAAQTLRWPDLSTSDSEESLRLAFMGAFLHVREAHLSYILLPEATPPKGFEKRLDLYLLPTWPPRQPPQGAMEFKHFAKGRPLDYLTNIGRRLSDLHYVECHSRVAKLHTFFFDVVLDPKLMGADGYASIQKLCKRASSLMYDAQPPVRPEFLKGQKGVKSFASAALDLTPRKERAKKGYGFLFPPMDLPGKGSGRAKRGTAIVGAPNEDGLIVIGTRRSSKEQRTPYRKVRCTDGTEVAFCFAAYQPGGKLVARTDTVLDQVRTMFGDL